MRTIIGFIIVLLGIGFLLQQLNVPWAETIIDAWWPFVIIAVGLTVWNGNRRQWFGPLVIVLVGVVIALDQTNVFSQSAWNYFWPMIIILVGGRLLLNRQGPPAMKAETGSADAQVFFSGVDRVVSGPFERGQVTAWFGGVKLDLRQAQFASDSTLNVSAGFGGVEILLPRSVRVVSKVTPVMGGMEDKSQPESGATHTLTIVGTAFFGGVGVKN